MLHARETWPLTKTSLQRNDRAMIRQICSIKPEDVARVRSSELLAKLELEDLDLILRERRLRWFGIRHVDLFSEITEELFLSHSEGKDRTVTIMKKINKSPKIECVPALTQLFQISQEFLFQYYQNMELVNSANHVNNKIDQKRNNNNNFTSGSSKLSTLDVHTGPKTLFSEDKVEDIQNEMDAMMQDIKTDKGLVAETANVGKRIQIHSQSAIDHHETYMELRAEYKAKYDEETTDNWLLLKLQNVLDELNDHAERSTYLYERCETKYETMRQKHRDILKQIQQKENHLCRLIVEEIKASLQHGVDQLKEISRSITITKTLKNLLESIDTSLIAHEIYTQLCSAYVFPDIVKVNNVITKGCAKIEKLDKMIMPTKERNKESHGISKVVRQDDIYLKTVQKQKSTVLSALTLKKGEVVKQKAHSEDGEVGFGWTRTVFGRKKWGFFKAQATQFHRNPKGPTFRCRQPE